MSDRVNNKLSDYCGERKHPSSDLRVINKLTGRNHSEHICTVHTFTVVATAYSNILSPPPARPPPLIHLAPTLSTALPASRLWCRYVRVLLLLRVRRCDIYISHLTVAALSCNDRECS